MDTFNWMATWRGTVQDENYDWKSKTHIHAQIIVNLQLLAHCLPSAAVI